MLPAFQLLFLAAALDGGTETLAQAIERQVRSTFGTGGPPTCTTIVSEAPVKGTNLRLIVFSDACTGASDSCADQGVLTSAAFVGPDHRLKETALLVSGGMGLERSYTATAKGFELSAVFTNTTELGGPTVSVTRSTHTLVPTPQGRFEIRDASVDIAYPWSGRYVDDATGEALHVEAGAAGHGEDEATAAKRAAFTGVAVGYTRPKHPARRALEEVSSSFERREVVVRFAPKGPQYKLIMSDDLSALSSERVGSGEAQYFKVAAP